MPANLPATDADIERAATLLIRGGVVAFPTETVYGLGADAWNEAAVRRIYAIKGRPPTHPLIVHLGDPEHAQGFAREFGADAQRLAAKFWPGALTIVVPRHSEIPDAVTCGGDTIGLRVPDHAVARALVRALGRLRPAVPPGIAAPSANRFGEPPPTSAQAVHEALGPEPDAIVDGGPCLRGVPSTLVRCIRDDVEVLRVGAIAVSELERALGRTVVVHTPA